MNGNGFFFWEKREKGLFKAKANDDELQSQALSAEKRISMKKIFALEIEGGHLWLGIHRGLLD